MPLAIITSGIPLAGKSTFVNRMFFELPRTPIIISRDKIRMMEFHLDKYSDYKFSKENEDRITRVHDFMLKTCIKNRQNVIVDNTHVKEGYLDALIKEFEAAHYHVYVVFFDIPLWKALVRNVIRNWRESKWIPWDVLKRMQSSYNKINKAKYGKYKLEAENLGL